MREAGSVSTPPRHLVIVGPMGVGKSTLGRALARALRRPFVDGDRALESHLGRTGRKIADEDGVHVLHGLEARVLLDALHGERPAVIAAAGSVVERPDVRRALADATVVWVDGPPRLVVERASRGSHRREIPLEEAEALDRRRRPRYRSVADITVDALRPRETKVEAVIEALDAVSDSG